MRYQEAKKQPLLKGTRYIFLKNKKNLTNTQRTTLETLKLAKLKHKSSRALRICEAFQEIYNAETENDFLRLLKEWYFGATHSRLDPIKSVAKTIKNHWEGIVEWKRSLINNGTLEGLNLVVQAAKSKGRGFRSFKCFKIIVYLTTGKLNFNKINADC